MDGTVVIEGGKITEVLTSHFSPLPSDDVIDAKGCFILPGVIDDHVHFREPGLTQKADIDTESMAAAAGGITSYFDMPNVGSAQEPCQLFVFLWGYERQRR